MRNEVNSMMFRTASYTENVASSGYLEDITLLRIEVNSIMLITVAYAEDIAVLGHHLDNLTQSLQSLGIGAPKIVLA